MQEEESQEEECEEVQLETEWAGQPDCPQCGVLTSGQVKRQRAWHTATWLRGVCDSSKCVAACQAWLWDSDLVLAADA